MNSTKSYLSPIAPLSKENIVRIKEATLQILEGIGVRFHHQPSLDLLKENGAKVEKWRAFLPRDLVEKYLGLAPATFSLHGRSPHRKLIIGKGGPVFSPGYGPPFLVGLDGLRRPGTIDDYTDLLRATHASDCLDINGGILVEPQDVPLPTRHLEMVLRTLQYTDKPFLGSVNGGQAAQDTIRLAALVMGGENELHRFPYVVAIINSKSPLAFDARMLEALHVYASHGQPIIIAPFIIAGVSGPVTLWGTLAQHNAEALAGVVLAQMIRAGTPVVYGTASATGDMHTGGPATGSPETGMLIGAIAQIGHTYDIPVRSGGALTDANDSDAQSGYEKMMTLLMTVSTGVDLVVHAAGILDSYLMMSLPQFVIDLEIIRYVKKLLAGISISEDRLGIEAIRRASAHGQFLTDPHTLRYFKSEFLEPELSDRTGYEQWEKRGKLSLNERAGRKWSELLGKYQRPPLDRAIEETLQAFIAKRREGAETPIL
jgi:trimethylamine--corrinoid protein Co-methyltransferase